jgi:hypothetical protein
MSSEIQVDHWYPTGTLTKPYEPVDVSDLEIVFPAHVSHLMPPAEDIPQEFLNWNTRNRFQKVISAWIFDSLNADTEVIPKDGIDHVKAFRHIKTILGSYEPKHEYKEAASAYLLSLWFEDIINWEKEK